MTVRVAIIGASGRTGTRLVHLALERGHEVAGVCRDATAHRLDAFRDEPRFERFSAGVVSDETVLRRALSDCDAVVAISIAVRELRATDLVASLATAGAANGVHRFVFTAGEITTVPEAGETFTGRQKVLKVVAGLLMRLTPYSLADMIEASRRIHAQADWAWTIVRAPTLVDGPAAGYRLGGLAEVTGRHALTRDDYAACLLDAVGSEEAKGRTLTVLPAS